MNSIELMKQEHQNILGLLECMRNACCAVLDGAQVNVSDFQAMREIAHAYADAHHHGKEEKILFPAMAEHLGSVAVNLIQHGMLVEHDMGAAHEGTGNRVECVADCAEHPEQAGYHHCGWQLREPFAASY